MASEFRAEDPDFEQKVRNSFGMANFMKYIGAKIEVVKPGHLEISAGNVSELRQQHGFVHAGVTTTLADVAGGFASFTLTPKGYAVLTVEFKINFVSPADGDSIIAVGDVIKNGKTLKISRSDVFSVKNGERKLCASSLQTTMCVKVDENNRLPEA